MELIAVVSAVRFRVVPLGIQEMTGLFPLTGLVVYFEDWVGPRFWRILVIRWRDPTGNVCNRVDGGSGLIDGMRACLLFIS